MSEPAYEPKPRTENHRRLPPVRPGGGPADITIMPTIKTEAGATYTEIIVSAAEGWSWDATGGNFAARKDDERASSTVQKSSTDSSTTIRIDKGTSQYFGVYASAAKSGEDSESASVLYDWSGNVQSGWTLSENSGVLSEKKPPAG